MSDIIGCQTYPIFDLTTRNLALIGNLNPAETIVSFHLSVNDATTNANPIANPTAYISETAKTIYARIDNKGTIITNYFNLIFPPPLQITWAMRVPSCEGQKGTALIDEIEIFSISGKSVLSKKINSNHSEIDLSQVSSGFYLLKGKSEGKTKTIKFIKE